MSRKSILVIGLGSAGKRFIEILATRKFEIYVYQHRKRLKGVGQSSPLATLDNLGRFYAAIIASPTATHTEYLKKLIEAKIPILVEKPLADNFKEAERVIVLARKNKAKIQVGFNLRYLPIIVKISDFLKNRRLGRILYANIYAGQYLPDWRSEKDYRKTYSASAEAGGGVALDLIHEIDLAQMWFRGIDLNLIRSKKLSDLEIDTEDFVEFATESRPYIRVTLDYLSMVKTRRYVIVGNKGSVVCDIFGQKFIYRSRGNKNETLTDENLFDIQKTYEKEIGDFLEKIKSGKEFDLSDRILGLDSLKLAVEARKNVQR